MKFYYFFQFDIKILHLEYIVLGRVWIEGTFEKLNIARIEKH